MNPRLNKSWLFGIFVVVVVMLYWPALKGEFVHDDYVNIVKNPNVHMTTFSIEAFKKNFIGVNTGLYRIFSRPVSMFSFSLNYYFAGLDPYWFKLTNLIIHLFIGFIVFHVVCLLLRASVRISDGAEIKPVCTEKYIVASGFLVAFIWLIHPLNVSTVMYPVQRMTQLSMLFLMLAYLMYLKFRVSQIDHQPRYVNLIVALLVLWPMSVLSKENGIIFPLLCLVSEIFILKFYQQGRVLKLLYALLAIGSILLVLYFIFNPEFITRSYNFRDFSLIERLLTESRVIWMYVSTIFIPNLGNMGLYLDYFPVSKNIYEPVTTLWSLLGIVGLIILIVYSRKRFALIGFGLAWFLVAHVIESSIIALEIAYEHRNYLPSIGLIIAFVASLMKVYESYPSLKKVGSGLLAMYLMLMMFVTHVRAEQWSSEFQMVAEEAVLHPTSYRANVELARISIDIGRYDEAQKAVLMAVNSARPSANVYITWLTLKHVQKEVITDAFYREMQKEFATRKAFVSIMMQFIGYIEDSQRYDWEDTDQLLMLAYALQENPTLQSKYAQGNIFLILAKLYSDKKDREKLIEYAHKAYDSFPGHTSIAKVYVHALMLEGKYEEARAVVNKMLDGVLMNTEKSDYIKLLDGITKSIRNSNS